MGRKFIIEFEDDPFENEDGEKIYRVKGFGSLVFDSNGVFILEQNKKLQDSKEFKKEFLEEYKWLNVKEDSSQDESAKLECGDEIVWDDGTKAVVLDIGACEFTEFDENGCVNTLDIDMTKGRYKRTGKKLPQIDTMLNIMRSKSIEF